MGLVFRALLGIVILCVLVSFGFGQLLRQLWVEADCWQEFQVAGCVWSRRWDLICLVVASPASSLDFV